MSHEAMRFGYMTTRQLWTRLGRITGTEKLVNFIQMAREFAATSGKRLEYELLAAAAEKKLAVGR